jgi:hypothetical protein
MRVNSFKAAAILLASVLVACSCASGSPPAWVLTLADVHEVESDLRLPAGAAPLKTYTREYAGRVEHGHHVVVGVLSGSGGEIIIDKSNDVEDGSFDGGCEVINVTYDLTIHKLLRLECHGVSEIQLDDNRAATEG